MNKNDFNEMKRLKTLLYLIKQIKALLLGNNKQVKKKNQIIHFIIIIIY